METSSHVNIVIFGATGDLATRKIYPSLYFLWREGNLPPLFRIVGYSRRDIGDEGLRDIVRESLLKVKVNDEPKVSDFLAKVFYVAGNFDDGTRYSALATRLASFDEQAGEHCSSRLLYLATPPSYYERLFTELAQSGLASKCQGDGSWVRIAVEKPFGSDLKTAIALDELLGKLFPEDSIFRIDHYLGKRTLQNILTFRFANLMFSQLWHRDYISSIHCRFFEKMGMERRGDTFDGIGALRDMGQNHLLQMLAAVTMEEPKSSLGEDVRTARASLIRSLAIPDSSKIVRAQFGGYREEEGVAKDSTTETYFRIETELLNERFKGVPLVMEGGKALGKDDVSIEILFRERPTPYCSGGVCVPNVLTFRLQPEPKIGVSFVVRGESLSQSLVSRELSFSFGSDEEDLNTSHRHEAYEHVLHSALQGDVTNVMSSEEVATSWAFVTPILQKFATLPLSSYDQGTMPNI